MSNFKHVMVSCIKYIAILYCVFEHCDKHFFIPSVRKPCCFHQFWYKFKISRYYLLYNLNFKLFKKAEHIFYLWSYYILRPFRQYTISIASVLWICSKRTLIWWHHVHSVCFQSTLFGFENVLLFQPPTLITKDTFIGNFLLKAIPY